MTEEAESGGLVISERCPRCKWQAGATLEGWRPYLYNNERHIRDMMRKPLTMEGAKQ